MITGEGKPSVDGHMPGANKDIVKGLVADFDSALGNVNDLQFATCLP